MKTFSELMELFDKEHEFTHTVKPLSDRTSEHRYEFEHKGKKFQAAIYHDKKTGESEVSFGDEHGRMGKTGESGKHSIDVFSKMASIIRHHVKTTPTAKEISFTSKKEDGEEGSRSSLYRKMTSRLGGTSTTGRKDVYHSIPADRITEETRDQKLARLRSDIAKKVDSGFARVQSDLDQLDKKTPPVVSPNKPIVGKDGAVGKLLASKGYDRSGKQTSQTKVVTRPELPTAPAKKSKSSPDDDIFAGGNSPLSAPEVKNYDRGKQDRQNQELAREKKWQSVYKKPAGYGTPSYDRARDKDDIKWKSNLPKDPYNDVPAETVPGSTRPQFVDTMKTKQAVPVPIPKPKAKPAEIDQRVPRPKLRPERTPAITNKDNTKGAVAITEPKSIGFNVKSSNKIQSKPTTPRPEGEQSFGQAFVAAKKRGDKEFSWKGGKYNTRTKK